jgi:hypothetical protein
VQVAVFSARHSRRQTEAATEAAVEIGKIVEAAFEGDIADAPFLAGEQIRSLTHS